MTNLPKRRVLSLYTDERRPCRDAIHVPSIRHSDEASLTPARAEAVPKSPPSLAMLNAESDNLQAVIRRARAGHSDDTTNLRGAGTEGGWKVCLFKSIVAHSLLCRSSTDHPQGNAQPKSRTQVADYCLCWSRATKNCIALVSWSADPVLICLVCSCFVDQRSCDLSCSRVVDGSV